MSEHQIEAIEAIFSFVKAMDEGGLSINDLIDVLRNAVDGGWDVLEVDVAMLATAIKIARPKHGAK